MKAGFFSLGGPFQVEFDIKDLSGRDRVNLWNHLSENLGIRDKIIDLPKDHPLLIEIEELLTKAWDQS